ncbi:hemerythrin domain-containing protein [Paraliomyxa miuraensis]|uniref:hemerythrin domain-containing protein n=1 Tax=Paraliomyxa miuraensis TaxID=376150 RepID=UPI002253496B|nr:hemerythrin domain-containing protein [Paraliomyxa miuraensis]MCX4240302.1 hemerythrin domain-containing protein [Paraliomyxa miuraensis]
MVIEKIKAAAKQAASALSGRAGILNTLEGEHAEVTALLDEILSASSITKAADDHYAAMRRKLLIHLRAEQEVLYPACEARPKTAVAVAGSRSEHQAVEDVVQELDRTSMDSPRWREQLQQLRQLVQAHVREEEDVLFAQCEEAFESRELRDLDRAYDEAKDRHHATISDAGVSHGPGARHIPPPRA